MGIFETISKQNKHKNSTRNFYFGAMEAEGENVPNSNLLNYFDDYLSILKSLEIGKFIFTGRKGVGKSAIAKYIKETSDNSASSFAKILKIADFELENYIQGSEHSDSKEKLIFEWLILVNLVRLLVKNQGTIYIDEYKKLNRFLDINSGLIDVDKYQFISGEKNKGGEVNINPLKHVFGGVLKNYFKSSVDKAPFYKLIPALREIVKKLLEYPENEGVEYWLMFDDLDINFSIHDKSSYSKVLELIRLCKDYNNDLFKGTHAKILIFLRDDMRDYLKPRFADSAKLFNSYEIGINWYIHNVQDDDDMPLKSLIDRRVELNFKKNNIDYTGDPWANLFSVSYISGKSTFKYVLDFTFYRPRDIITFLNVLTQEDYNFPIDAYNLKRILKKYIRVNVSEIRSELSLFFGENEIAFLFDELFPFIIKESVCYDKLKEKIEKFGFNMPSADVIELLSKYSLILLRDSAGNLYFQYRDDSTEVGMMNDGYSFTLPKCIYHHYKRIN